MKIHCKYDSLVNPKDLKEHKKNRNKHGQDQIERLAKLYEYHGIRHPIICDADSRETIIAGRGRQLAAIRAGIEQFPVVYQKFDSDEQRYAFIQSDNAVALWADLDLSGINSDLPDLGPDFDLEVLGIKNFTMDFDPGSQEDQGKLDEKKLVFMICPHCGENFEQGQATKLKD